MQDSAIKTAQRQLQVGDLQLFGAFASAVAGQAGFLWQAATWIRWEIMAVLGSAAATKSICCCASSDPGWSQIGGGNPLPPPIHTMRDLAMLRPDLIVHFVQKTPSLNEVPQFATEHITYH